MLGRHLFWLISFICLTSECSSSSSSSSLRRSLVRRQSDAEPCQAIQGFDCKCTSYRATCTNDRDLPSPLVIVESAKGKYQSVEIVLTAARDLHVNDQTFEPIQHLFKTDAFNYEFRVKFEKFTALHLASAGIFNRVFPDSSPSVRKHIALEIYNPDVPPQDNNRLFENLNVDSLELYALYPFHGTFQQLFNGANIKYLRLSGGDIRSDFSQPFTGNIARLELAKQATSLSVENFPVYPAHEMIINAFYISDFNNEHVPNYNNLVELRVHSTERIPANAFQRFSNVQTLSVTSEKDIDSQAFNGLNQLEKLIIKDTKPSADLLAHLPPVKEFETNVDKLDERTQCQLLDKLAAGQLALQAVPNGRECTCVSAYLDKAAGRTSCDAQGCEASSCAAIRNNYDAATREFQSPPTIRRADGSDALRQREPKVYSSAYQVSPQDQDKLSRAIPPQQQQQHHDQDHQQQPDIRPSVPSYDDDRVDDSHRHHPAEDREDRPSPPMRDDQHYPYPQPQPRPHQNDEHRGDEDDEHSSGHRGGETSADAHGGNRPPGPSNDQFVNDYDQQVSETRTTKPTERDPSPSHGHQPHQEQQQQEEEEESPFQSDYDRPVDDQTKGDESHHHHQHDQHPDKPRPQPTDGPVGDGSSNGKTDDDGDDDRDGTKDEKTDGTKDDEQSNREPGEGNTNPVGPNDENRVDADGEETTAATGTSAATKKGMSWIPIIIIVAAIVVLLVLGAIYFLVIRRKPAAGGASGAGGAAGTSKGNYQAAPTSEPAARA